MYSDCPQLTMLNPVNQPLRVLALGPQHPDLHACNHCGAQLAVQNGLASWIRQCEGMLPTFKVLHAGSPEEAVRKQASEESHMENRLRNTTQKAAQLCSATGCLGQPEQESVLYKVVEVSSWEGATYHPEQATDQLQAFCDTGDGFLLGLGLSLGLALCLWHSQSSKGFQPSLTADLDTVPGLEECWAQAWHPQRPFGSAAILSAGTRRTCVCRPGSGNHVSGTC